MAITGTALFTSGEVLTADAVNQYLMRGVKVFADATVRAAAYGGAGEPTLNEGETSYLLDTNALYTYDGAAWQNASAVSSVFTRTGAVVATAGDYTGIASGSVGVYNGAVASGSAIAITGPGTYFLTGTTAVNTITGATVAGTVVTLVASGQAARVCVVINNAATANAITLKNSQAVGLYSSDSITLVYTGAYWQEITRALKPIIDYVAVTTSSITINTTTAATAITVLTGNAITFDGASAYRYEYFSPLVPVGTANSIRVGLWEDGTQISQFFSYPTSVPVNVVQIRTPTNASHTATIRSWVDTGSGEVRGGAGTAGAQVPQYLGHLYQQKVV